MKECDCRILTVVSELVPLRGENIFKPRPQSVIFVPLVASFQNFLLAFPSLLKMESPPGEDVSLVSVV